jgi:hypothetical protein
MESQKARKCNRIVFMADAKLDYIAEFKKIPVYAGMTTYTFFRVYQWYIRRFQHFQEQQSIIFENTSSLIIWKVI